MTDFQGRAWFLSTPKGWLTTFTRSTSAARTQRSRTGNLAYAYGHEPDVPAQEIEAARQDLSEAAWSQEYDARFVSWEGVVFRRILDAIAEPPTNVPAVAIGVDWGRSNDYTVFTGVSTGGQVLAIDRFPRVGVLASADAARGVLGAAGAEELDLRGSEQHGRPGD